MNAHGFFRFFPLFLFLYLPCLLFGQSDYLTRSEYGLVYRLDAQRVNQFVGKNATRLTQAELVNLLDTVPFADDKLDFAAYPFGHYAKVIAQGSNFQLKWFQKPSVAVEPILMGTQTLIQVHELASQESRPTQLFLNGSPIAFDPELQGYLLPRRKRYGRIRVSQEGENWFFFLSRNRITQEKLWYSPGIQQGGIASHYYRSRGSQLGYIVLNQPEYRVGDTVKLKAFRVNKKGKPTKEKLVVYLNQPYPGKQLVLDTLVPQAPGTYLLNYPIPDSLRLDQRYYVLLRPAKKGRGLATNFLLRDYELDEVEYTAEMDKYEFEGWETVSFSAGGTEAGGLPIADGRVKIELKATRIDDWEAERELVPDILWEFEKELSGEGTTTITVPDSVLPAIAGSFELALRFNNSNNESHDTLLFFNRKLDQQKVVGKLDDAGKIRFDLMKSGKKQDGWGKVVPMYAHKIADAGAEANFPISVDLDPNVKFYTVITEQDTQEVNPQGMNAGVRIKGETSGDSAHYWVENPLKLPLSWELFQGKKQIAQGHTTEIDWKGIHKRNKALELRVNFIWKGINSFRSKPLARFRNQLQFEVDQKEKVTPGESATITVKVKDYTGKPVENVNMVAWAVNNQFENLRSPDLNYLGKRQKSKTPEADPSASLSYQNTGEPLSKGTLDRMDLDTALYYKMLFPDSGLMHFYMPLPGDQCEIAPHIVQKGKKLTIHVIYLNGRLTYVSKSNGEEPFSFLARGGKNTLRVRTNDQWITLRNIKTKAGFKLDVVLDLDRLPKGATVEKAKEGELSRKEAKRIHPYMMYGTYATQYQNQAYLMNGNRVFKLHRDYDWRWCLGPMMYSNSRYKEVGKEKVEFQFESGYGYEFQPPKIKMTPYPSFPKSFRTLTSWRKKQPFCATTLHWKKINWQTPFAYLNSDPLQYEGEWLPPRVISPAKSSTLILQNETDSLVHYQILMHKGDTENFWFQGGRERIWKGLAIGTYDLFWVTQSGNYIKETIQIDERGTLLRKVTIQAWNPPGKWESVFRTHDRVEQGPHGTPIYRNLGHSFGNLNVSGKVLDASNNHVKSGIRVQLISHRMETICLQTETDANGKFDLNGIAPEVYRIHAFGPDNQLAISILPIRSDGTIDPIELHLTDSLEAWNAYRDQLRKINLSKEEYGSDIQAVLRTVPGVYIDGEPRLLSETALEEVVVIRGGRASGFIQSFDAISRPKLKSKKQSNAETTASFAFGVKSDEITDSIQAGNVSFEQSRLGMLAGGKSIAMNDRYAELSGASGLRSQFADHAYWKPILLTDKKGEATFTVKYPDNITSWKGWIVGMDDKKKGGMISSLTQAYKPVMARLSTPRFLVQGDEVEVIGKAQNLEADTFAVTTTFKIEGELQKSNAMSLERFTQETFSVNAGEQDTLSLEYALQIPAAEYTDGEERKIPIFRKGTEEAIGLFVPLETDTTFTYTLPAGLDNPTVYMQFDLLEVLLSEIEKLEEYPHGCNEQITSKLKGYLAKEQIYKTLGRPFEDKNKVRKLIAKLKRSQSRNGGWAWWSKGKEQAWMTAYVCSALTEAEKMGYNVSNSLRSGRYFLTQQIPRQDLSLSVYLMMAEMDMKVDFISIVEQQKVAPGNLYRQLQFARLQQIIGGKYDSTLVQTHLRETWAGGSYPGAWGLTTFEQSIPMSVLAYKILAGEGRDADGKPKRAELLIQLRRHLILERSHKGWLNTLQSAEILSLILPDLVKEYGKGVVDPQVITLKDASGKELLRSDTTRTWTLPTGTRTLTLDKKGFGTVFFTVYGRRWNAAPEPLDSLFEVETWLEEDGEKVETLTGGEAARMRIKVKADRSYEYLVLEVPIPAGCSYGNNFTSPHVLEAHREYKKDKTYIYLESLPVGEVIFDIQLAPRYRGTFTLNPAKIENMYFPTLAGRNRISRVQVK